MSISYAVGWYQYSEEQLIELFPPEYRQNPIITFGKGELFFFSTPGEAYNLLQQLKEVNNENNLKSVCPLGAEGLFVVEIAKEETGAYTYYYRQYKRYHYTFTTLNGAYCRL